MGGAGITICERWNDFKLFLEDMGPCPEGAYLCRIDKTKGYSKENCVWAMPNKHLSNRKLPNNVIYFTYKGIEYSLRSFCDKYSIPYDRINRQRLKYWLDHSKPLEKFIEKYSI